MMKFDLGSLLLRESVGKVMTRLCRTKPFPDGIKGSITRRLSSTS